VEAREDVPRELKPNFSSLLSARLKLLRLRSGQATLFRKRAGLWPTLAHPLHKPQRVGHPVPVTPMNNHPEEWRDLEYVDIYTGQKYRLFDSLSRKHNRSAPLPQTYGAALQQFLRHPESKYDGSVGLLKRWTVRATGDPHLLGKEVERRREQGDDIANILMEAPIEYVQVRYRTTAPLSPIVIEMLKQHSSIKELARKTGLGKNVIRRALRGKPIWKHSRTVLMRVCEDLRYGRRENT
jgi:hypothetical protein